MRNFARGIQELDRDAGARARRGTRPEDALATWSRRTTPSERRRGALPRAKGAPRALTIWRTSSTPSDEPGVRVRREAGGVEAESRSTPPPRRDAASAPATNPPSIGLESAAPRRSARRWNANANARGRGGDRRRRRCPRREQEHKTRVRHRAVRGGEGVASVFLAARGLGRGRANPPGRARVAHVAVSRADIEAAARGGGGGDARRRPACARRSAAANVPRLGTPAPEKRRAPPTDLARPRRLAIEIEDGGIVSSASAVKAARKVTSAGKKKRARARRLAARVSTTATSLGRGSRVVADDGSRRGDESRRRRVLRRGEAREARAAGGAGGEGRGALVGVA